MFEENKAIARRFMEEAWSEGKLDIWINWSPSTASFTTRCFRP